MKISTSILATDNKINCLKQLNHTTTDYIHLDIMDGTFVPNNALPIEEIQKINKITKKKLDIHLMVENPIYYINQLSNMNIEYITFHIEATSEIEKVIKVIKQKKYKVGIAISPNTGIETIIPYLKDIDLVLVMSVFPGRGGQNFIPSSLEKIRALSLVIKEKKYHTIIEVDGGIKDYNLKDVVNSGSTIAVIGSYITNTTDYQKTISELKS